MRPGFQNCEPVLFFRSNDYGGADRPANVKFPACRAYFLQFIGNGSGRADDNVLLQGSRLMRILIYSTNFSPETTGIGKYSGDMAIWLAENGHSVTVVAAPPYYPQWKVRNGYAWPPFRREKLRGVDVWRAPLWVPKSPGGLARILHLLSFAITSFPVMMRLVFWRPDLVLTVAPAFVCAPTALLTARLCGAKSWLHLQDFEVDVAFRLGLMRGKLLQRVVLRMERWVLQRFDTVSSISRRMIERLLTKGVTTARTRYFPNWVDTSRIRHGTPKLSYRAQLGIPDDAVVVLFSGSLAGKQGLMIIPEAARILAGRGDVAFVVCGDGVMKPKLEAAVAGLSNVHLLPLQPVERLSDLLGMADIHLLPQSPDAADLVLPSKLSGMLASGRPVIATCRDGTEIGEIVRQCGLVVAPQDSSALAGAIARLADDRTLRQDLGRRARELAEGRFERNAVLGGIFGDIENDLAGVANDVVV
jgi:colanic acid biosynthesis glycosyl transferase WcaI